MCADAQSRQFIQTVGADFDKIFEKSIIPGSQSASDFFTLHATGRQSKQTYVGISLLHAEASAQISVA